MRVGVLIRLLVKTIRQKGRGAKGVLSPTLRASALASALTTPDRNLAAEVLLAQKNPPK